MSQDVSGKRIENVVDRTEGCGDLQDVNDGDAYEFDEYDSEFLGTPARLNC